MNQFEERDQATKMIAIQHESDCGKPGIFSAVSSNSEGVWTVVIEHYDPAIPLEHVGTPCRYTAEHNWQVICSA